MRIIIDRLFSRLLCSLSTPPITVSDEEQLLFSERFQAREMKIRFCLVVLLPCVVRCRQPSSIGNVFTQCQSPVDMENLVVGTNDCKLGILINKALCTLFECFDGLVVPPISVVSTLIIVSTSRIKSYIISMKRARRLQRDQHTM